MRTIFHVEFAKTWMWLSGWEKCMIELIKYFVKKKERNVILTTDNWRTCYESLWLKEGKYLSYKIIESYQTETLHIFISYLLRIPKIVRLLRGLMVADDDIVFCHSDFFPNTIPTYLLSRKNPAARMLYFFHMLAPNLLKGYEGEYTWKYQFPRLNIVHYKLNQLLYILLIRKIRNPGKVITVNPIYKEYLSRVVGDTYALKHFGGEETYVISKYSWVDAWASAATKKQYDISFLGRFHPQKGIEEIIDIVVRLKKQKQDIRVLVIWGWDASIVHDFCEQINRNDLTKNIDYRGPITSEYKFELLAMSKLFLFPSYYESFWQVALEAMKLWLPVVAYNLPPFCVFEKGMIKVPVKDNAEMVRQIAELLNNKKYYEEMSRNAVEFAWSFSWSRTWEEVFNLIKK